MSDTTIPGDTTAAAVDTDVLDLPEDLAAPPAGDLGDSPSPDTLDHNRAWVTEPVAWHVDNFTAENPFRAELVIEASATQMVLSLDPPALNALHDALGLVRTAQKAAILGVEPGDVPDTTTAASDTTTVTNDRPVKPAKRKRGRIPLLVIGSLMGLAMVYSLIAGAVRV